ncbi:hypothetical protein P4O66_004448 [Electrophorus voltai]|uniref:VWFD domain-containing protein n=1 Tax=Electrophorus voltai TaxID=2609070 RepID=A0AAD8ZNJ4_9TELE|nr:hypothetical protein P4O66_004448 [Electrophorus voltai]
MGPWFPSRAGLEREMTCRSWGQYNYETFDGLYYYFPGKCSYTLLKDCEDNTQSSVLIQVHNDPECGFRPYSCTRSVSLFLPWEGEIRLQNYNVSFKGQSVQLPHNIHDIELERIADYILVSQAQGFMLAWQGLSSSIYIKMSPEFVGRTCGLCGNFNADIQDDLKTSYGMLTEDIAIFGNSWMEEEPQGPTCPTIPSFYPSPCSTQDPHILMKVEEVCASLLKEPFKSCHQFVSPYSYMASCSNDLCLSGPNGIECPLGLHYRECITCCPVHCSVERMCIDNKLQCLDGCYCPDGECSVTGDMYFQSFDGHVYTFLATCQYVLAKSRNSGGFIVTIQNAPCGPNLDGACIQSVNLILNDDPRTEVTLSHSEVFQIQELSSMFVQVKTSQGLLLQYNWREFRLYLQLGELWRDDTVGLCGTFNGNIQDDFLSECPCSFLGAEYSPGDVILTSSSVQICQDGKLILQTIITDKLCPPGQVYEDCGNRLEGPSTSKGLACLPTCESYLLNLTCSIHEPCVPGCVCPAGLLKHGDECFEPIACPCLWKGKEYYPGDRVSSPCHQCVCQHGSFQCEFHPCASMCTLYGDRHYRTFDGLIFDYIGACKVYLLKNPASMIERQNVYIWNAGYFTFIHLLQYELSLLWDRKTTIHIQAGPRWQVDVTWFYMNCLADTCGCSRGGDCECFCTSVAVYAHRCCHHGITIDWRTPSLCRFFLHYMLSRLQLLKYNHSDRYRRATLFKLAAGSTTDYSMGPLCQWRYESCVSPCFRTCSDPAARSCVDILKVEGCVAQCPVHMVLDEVLTLQLHHQAS